MKMHHLCVCGGYPPWIKCNLFLFVLIYYFGWVRVWKWGGYAPLGLSILIMLIWQEREPIWRLHQMSSISIPFILLETGERIINVWTYWDPLSVDFSHVFTGPHFNGRGFMVIHWDSRSQILLADFVNSSQQNAPDISLLPFLHWVNGCGDFVASGRILTYYGHESSSS